MLICVIIFLYKKGDLYCLGFFITLFFLVLISLVSSIIIPVYNNHCKATGDVINYDSMMRKYVYKVYMSREQIINKLKTITDFDELYCDFDIEKTVISFSEYGANKKYHFQVQECEGFSVLRLEQVTLVGMQSHYAKSYSIQTKSVFHKQITGRNHTFFTVWLLILYFS